MKRKVSSRLITFAILTLLAMPSVILFASISPTAHAATTVSGLSGPWADKVVFNVVEDSNVQTLQVEHGDALMGDWTVGASKISELQAAGVTVNTTPQAGVFFLAMNQQVWPTNDVAFRKAVSHLVNRDDVVATAYQGYAIGMKTMVPPFYGNWYNPNAVTYDYSTTAAAAELTKGGWVYSATSHTWTDPQGRVLAWGGNTPGTLGTPCSPAGYTVPCTVQIQTRTDPGRKYFAAQMATNAKAADIPVVSTVMSRTQIFNNLYYSNPPNYVAATAGYLFPPPVDLDGLLYTTFASSQDTLVTSSPVTWGPNFLRVHDAALDAAVTIVHSSNNKTAIQNAAWAAQKIIADSAYVVPVYTWVVINAYNLNFGGQHWEGAVNLANQGVFNDYTFLNMSLKGRQAGGTITADLLGDLDKFNPILMGITTSVWEGYVVGGLPEAVFDSAAAPDPTNAAGVIPWAANWWTTSASGAGQVITVNLRQGMTFHDRVPVTAADYAYSAWLWNKTVGSASVFAPDIANAVAVNSTEVQITLKSPSYWRLQQVLVGLPILPQHIWQKHDPLHANDWASVHPEVTGELIGSGLLVFEKYQPGQYIIMDLYKNYWLSPTLVTPTLLKVTAGQPLALTLPSGNIRLPMNVTTVIRDQAGVSVYAQTQVIYSRAGYPLPGGTLNVYASLPVGSYQRTTVFVYNFTRVTVTDAITGNPVNVTRGQTVQQQEAFQVIAAPPPTTVTSTSATTSVVTSTTTVASTDYTTVSIVGLVALIIGAVGSYVATRRRT